jgi:hypothetical protein
LPNPIRSHRLPWLKFYPENWLSDPALRACSATARGVAIDLLCIAHAMPNRGVFRTNGVPWSVEKIAFSVREPVDLVLELIENAVLKRSDKGEIYWSRIVKDEAQRSVDRTRKVLERKTTY